MAIKRSTADKHFSECVRERADWTCQHCGKTEGRLECAHIYGRRAAITRWMGLNAVCLCHWCHREFTGNPLDFHLWLEEELGEGWLGILKEKRNGILKKSKATEKEVAKHYLEQVKIMRERRGDGATGWLEFVSYN